ncbi:MAG: gene transfer agent family protein [Pseudomonadota bacterium]
MTNKRRGEINACLDDKQFRLCLTLGALAELEAAFDEEDMLALASRFENGRLKSKDAVRIIAAGLRGAGYDIEDNAVAAMACGGGAAGYVAIVAELLEATFGMHDNDTSRTQPVPDAARPAVRERAPFRGAK